MGYWHEGSVSTDILPTSTFNVMGQPNEIGGSVFRAALVNTDNNCVICISYS